MKENICLADYSSSGLSPELSNWYTSHFSGLLSQAVAESPSHAVTLALTTILDHYKYISLQDNIHGFLSAIKAGCRLSASLPSDRQNVTDDRLSVDDLS
jgi:hypothetical protein